MRSWKTIGNLFEEVHMRAIVLFGAGIVCGILMMQPSVAQGNKGKGRRLNHVGVNVKNYQESLDFYTKTLGFREAFTVKDDKGNPTLTYVQIDKGTFVELQPAGDRPVGMTHVGLWLDDINAEVSSLKKAGVKVEDPRVGRTDAPLTNITDPNGARFELMELTPGSLQRKAVESWK
jgi:catechol 2,3-dioxygenase-like lactoylglutathione lyase family enzyme